MNHIKGKAMAMGLAAVLAGAVLGIVLRLVLMQNFFDYDTGFYTDNGLMAWLSLGGPVRGAALAGFFCYRGRELFGGYEWKRATGTGVLACLSGVFLLRLGVIMAQDYHNFLNSGLSQYDSVKQGVLHVLFIVASLIFGLVQVATSIGFILGKNIFKKLPLLYLAGPFWGISYLILVYLFYAKSSSVVENIFAVIGAAALLLSLFYICRIFAGVEVSGAARRLFAAGGVAVTMVVSYVVGNIALFFQGKTYAGEMPVECQMGGLLTALFVLSFMCHYNQHRISDPKKILAVESVTAKDPGEEDGDGA